MVNATTVSSVAANYSATILTTNNVGVPTALLNNATFLTVGTAANDLTGPTPDITIRYVIDRLCATGTVIATAALCVQSSANPTGGKANNTAAVTPPSATVYRVSVRVTGARGTQVFLQSSFTKPDT
jgi:hypothetical protein